jgi:protein-disulfide isomerase
MTAPRLVERVSARDHVLGPKHAPVTVVEYGDFVCPHSRRAHLLLEELLEAFSGRMRLVYRHFPLTQVHPQAAQAAEAAEIAAAHGRFWQMRDLLSMRQQLDDAHLVEYAASLGVDPAQFTRALACNAFQERVRQDFVGGIQSGVNGTPTFFLNGVRYDGRHDFDSLFAAIGMVAEVASVRTCS